MTCLFGVVTMFFMLDTPPEEGVGIKRSDIALGVILLLLPFAYLNNKNIFSCKEDLLAQCVYIFMALYWVELIITLIIGHETLNNSLKVIRTSFFMWLFFLLRAIPLHAYKSFLKIALFITLLQSALFFLQFADIHLLFGERDVDAYTADYYITNMPPMTAFFLYFSLKLEYLKKTRYIVFAILLILIFSTFMRGTIIGVLIGLAFYAIFIGQNKKRIQTIIIILLITPIALKFINEKSEVSGGFKGLEEIEHTFSQWNNMTNLSEKDGTFSFRMAMLYERYAWLEEHPKYLLTGVGTMHEDSHRTLQMFDFILGTNNEKRYYGQTIIESGDIAWVPVILRYGLIGILIHLMLIIILFYKTWKRKDILVMLSPYMVYLFIRSFNGALFELPQELFLLSLCFAMVSCATMKKESLYL